MYTIYNILCLHIRLLWHYHSSATVRSVRRFKSFLTASAILLDLHSLQFFASCLLLSAQKLQRDNGGLHKAQQAQEISRDMCWFWGLSYHMTCSVFNLLPYRFSRTLCRRFSPSYFFPPSTWDCLETVLNSIANIERLQNVMVQYLVHHHASAWSLQAISAPWGMDWHKVILACHNLSWFFCVGKIELQSGNISKEWMWTVHTLLNSTESERTRTTSAKRFQPPWASNLLPRTLREQVANGP